MTKVDSFRKVTLTTSGDLLTRTSYAESATYRENHPDSSDMTADKLVVEYKTRGLIVKATTPSTRRQDRVARINERLQRLAK